MQITLDISEELIHQLSSTPEEILLMRPSKSLQAQIDRLSDGYQAQTLTPQEQQLWQQYEYLEHIIRMAKAKAYLKLNCIERV